MNAKKPMPFEKSAQDKEAANGPKEGSKKEEAMDLMQARIIKRTPSKNKASVI
jgi:hypothetical protein